MTAIANGRENAWQERCVGDKRGGYEQVAEPGSMQRSAENSVSEGNRRTSRDGKRRTDGLGARLVRVVQPQGWDCQNGKVQPWPDEKLTLHGPSEPRAANVMHWRHRRAWHLEVTTQDGFDAEPSLPPAALRRSLASRVTRPTGAHRRQCSARRPQLDAGRAPTCVSLPQGSFRLPGACRRRRLSWSVTSASRRLLASPAPVDSRRRVAVVRAPRERLGTTVHASS